MSTDKHNWETLDPYDGGYHICTKCKLGSQGKRSETPCPVSDAEHHAVAWLGQAGLYRTRYDAVRNCEQVIAPVSTNELFELAREQIVSQLNAGRQATPPAEKI